LVDVIVDVKLTLDVTDLTEQLLQRLRHIDVTITQCSSPSPSFTTSRRSPPPASLRCAAKYISYHLLYGVSGKKRQKCFSNIPYKTPAILMKFGVLFHE